MMICIGICNLTTTFEAQTLHNQFKNLKYHSYYEELQKITEVEVSIVLKFKGGG